MEPQTKRPSPPDPAEVWDRLVESCLAQANTPASVKPLGLQTLRLTKEPMQRHQGRVRRSVAQIEPALREAFRSLVSGKTPWPLFLHGPAGTGKSCAALCLLDHATGEYWTTTGFCEHLNDATFGRLVARGEGGSVTIWPVQFWAKVQRAPLVVLDELGTRDVVSNAHYDAVKRIIDEREGLPLVVISNLDLESIARLYDDRIASRLGAGTIVQLRGRDRRIDG